MLYLNRDLSIQGLHAELNNAIQKSAFGVLIFEIEDAVYQIQTHSIGLCLIDELGKIVKTASLKDYDFAENNKQAVDYLISDLYDQITTFC